MHRVPSILTGPSRAAANVLRSSLRAEKDVRIMLIFDRFGQDIADAFIHAARALDYNLTPIYVPYEIQKGKGLRRAVRQLAPQISAAAGLITCLNDSHEATNFRRAILDLSVECQIKCVHMPGVDENTFVHSTMELDLVALDKRACTLAEILRRATSAEIFTISQRDQSEHSLSLSLRNRDGHADGGLARAGHVINIPTGEAYIAPVETSAHGSIVINGSFPERDLSKGGEVLLTFEKGLLLLEKSLLPESGTGEYCRELLNAAKKSAPKYLQIGELGLGLNPAVRVASGRTIVDEKAFGSAHIALGANTTFGGRNRAPFHHDLVFYPTAIHLDGHILFNEWHTPTRRLWEE